MTPDGHDVGGMLRAGLDVGVVLQRLPLGGATPIRPLYWTINGGAARMERGLHLSPGATLSSATYFGALFELPWLLYSRAAGFTLRLRFEGEAAVRLWRRCPDGRTVMLAEETAVDNIALDVPADTPHFRQAGYLWFELTALDEPVLLVEGAWTTACRHTNCGLGVVICTYNRQAPLGALLDAIADAADPSIPCVIVVNQGTSELAAHPDIAGPASRLGTRLRVIEQANLGGAGGFGRGMLEALDDPAISHVCLLDDDVRLEPECLRRMAAFFALAQDGVAVGGHMLDSVQPTVLYESGARVAHNWVLRPLHHGLDLAAPENLARLLDVTPMHFNGWWMFGFDKRLIERVGLPLPCFIRGDDVEFGLRLQRHGVVTVPLPGVAVWHEPFYLKIGGWQLYYETRNALVCAALHQSFAPGHVAVQVLKRLLIHLLTYRYYNAALVVRATGDFLRGPAILDGDPRPLHASLAELQTRYPDAWTPRERVLQGAPVGESPKRYSGFVAVMLLALLRNGLRPTRGPAEPARLDVRDLVWFRVIQSDALAVDTYWDRHLPTYRRDRAAFTRLLRDGLREVWRLYRAANRIPGEWHGAAPRLTSVAFWRRYVGL